MTKIKIIENTSSTKNTSSHILNEKVNEFIKDKNVRDIQCTSSIETDNFGTENAHNRNDSI